jgi:hypothetical protein
LNFWRNAFVERYGKASLFELCCFSKKDFCLIFGERALEALKVASENNGAELVRRCRAGDGAAWEEIVSLYSRRIFNLAYRFTSSVEAAARTPDLRAPTTSRRQPSTAFTYASGLTAGFDFFI